MEKSINIRAGINKLEIGGAPLVLPKSGYKVSVVRSTAGGLTSGTGKKFRVNGTDKSVIVVTRIS